MSETFLNGDYSREPEVGQADYYVFRLNIPDLRQLASLLRGLLQSSPLAKVTVGKGRLLLQVVSNGFTFRTTNEGAIILEASKDSMANLAAKLEAMAGADADPDYLVHSHLDIYSTEPPFGLSDIVIERLDEYHMM